MLIKSFYTPSAITGYMCAESLRKVVVQKFNEANPAWCCKNVADIEYEIHREIRQVRTTPSLRGVENTEAIHPTPSLRGSEATEAIHESKK